jgi:serine/threonine protein kinase
MDKKENIKFKASNFVVQHKGKMRDYYRICKLLGEGGFGEVRECIHKDSCVKRAVKI